MPVERFTWSFPHQGKTVSIAGIRSAREVDASGSPKPWLVFENSWNIPPLPDYHEMLDALDERFNVVGLSKNGLNNLARLEPRTIDGHAALTVSWCRSLLAGGKVSSFSLLGHSMGFATAYRIATQLPESVRCLMGVAPLLPGEHSLAAFLSRFLVLGIGMGALGTSGAAGRRYFWQSGPRYLGRFLRNPMTALALIGDMARFRIDVPATMPTLIVEPYRDELVPSCRAFEATARGVFPQLSWVRMTGRTQRHSLPLLFGRTVATLVAQTALDGGVKAPRSA